MRHFRPGESVVWRSVDREKRVVQTVLPYTVVRDEHDIVVLYMPAGTMLKYRTGRRGGPRGRMLLDWDGGHAERMWRDTNVLVFHRLGDSHSVWLARDAATDGLAWWYVNLEAPWARTAIGFDSRDHILDLVMIPGGDWRWKDEDELEWAIANGRMDSAARERLRAEGERAKARLARRDPPLDEAWASWRPQPGWGVPALPSGWRDWEPEG